MVETLAAGCLKCHGASGRDTSPETPNLACQKEEYLINQLKAFKAAARKADVGTFKDKRFHDVMLARAKNLSNAAMESLASYFSSRSCR